VREIVGCPRVMHRAIVPRHAQAGGCERAVIPPGNFLLTSGDCRRSLRAMPVESGGIRGTTRLHGIVTSKTTCVKRATVVG
jgi:hypothetical protein